MLGTDGWVFLDIRNPMCAWNVYRGGLSSVPEGEGFISVWAAGLLRQLKDGNPGAIKRELALEMVRADAYPNRISRLKGLYCFQDLQSAESALKWGNGINHFRPAFLAELHLGKATSIGNRLDSSWITHAPLSSDGSFSSLAWIPNYWAGSPMPGREPLWETVVEGRAWILGTDLRERAYALLSQRFPESLLALETARLAAWVGSDFGNIAGWLHAIGESEIELDYLLDARDAPNEDFQKKMKQLVDDPEHPKNVADVQAQLAKGNFGRWPDLRPLGFRLPMEGLEQFGILSTTSRQPETQT